MNGQPPVRVLALMEATSVTGPAKNLIGFCRWAQSPEGADAGLRLQVATYHRGGGDGSDNGFVKAAREAGVTAHVIHERGRFDRAVMPQLAEIVAAVRPHVIQTHNGKSHVLVKWLGLNSERVWLAFQHGYQDTNLKLHLYNQVDRWTLRSADRVISVCQAFAPRLVAFGVRAERIRVLHNSVVPPPPVAGERRAELRQRFGVRDDESVLLCIGRFSREKGHADLLAALGGLRRPARPWKLILVGDGPEAANLKRQATALGIADRVVFAGFQKDALAFYAIADVFVLPSHSEGSSNVLLEAMAARVPIAATAVGGNPEIVADGATALLTPGGDPAALRGSLERLLGDDDLAARLAANAFDRAIGHFSPQHYRRTLLAIYADALGGAVKAGAREQVPA